MKTASAKSKGRKLQQYVRDSIINTFKKYGVEAADVKSAGMGQGGEDVQLSPFARGFFPYSVECKSHKSMAIYNVYQQAASNCGQHEPLVVVKINNRKPLAVVDFNHYMLLVEAADLKEKLLDD